MIEIDYPSEGKIFCPACGKLILDISGTKPVMNECSHLEFLGTNEGGEIDKNSLYEQSEEGGGDGFYEYVKTTLDDHYVCFTQHGAGEMVEGYTIFKFEES